MEKGTKCGLPFLRLENSVSVRLAGVECLEVQLTDRAGLWARRKLEIIEIRNQIRAIHESNFRIEVGLYDGMSPLRLNQIAVVGCYEAFGPVLATLLRQVGRCFRVVTGEAQPLEEKKVSVHARGPVEAIERVAAFLVDRDGADVGFRQDLSFHSRHHVVRPWTRAIFAGSRVEETDVIVAQCSCDLRSNIQRHLLPCVWIDADLPAEEQLRGCLSSEMEEGAVFQEERSFFR